MPQKERSGLGQGQGEREGEGRGRRRVRLGLDLLLLFALGGARPEEEKTFRRNSAVWKAFGASPFPYSIKLGGEVWATPFPRRFAF